MVKIKLKAVQNILKKHKNIFLEGGAGTGKTESIKKYVRSLSKSIRRHTLIMAPTGLAANRYKEGKTIHRTIGLDCRPYGPDECVKLKRMLKNVRLIIIDEVSMVRTDTMNVIILLRNEIEAVTGRTIPIILVGDTQQLPPVITDKDRLKLNSLWTDALGHPLGVGWFFESPLYKQAGFVHYFLEDNLRNPDPEFNSALTKVRNGDGTAAEYYHQFFNPDMMYAPDIQHLCYTNAMVDNINDYFIRQHTGRLYQFPGFVKNEDGYFIPADDSLNRKFCGALTWLNVFVGMRVMMIKNSKEYKNGMLGYITDITHEVINDKDRDYIIVLLDDGRTISVKPEMIGRSDDDEYIEGKSNPARFMLQYPLVPAWAITIHKSQGQTFQSVVLHLQGCKRPALVYTAISRVAQTEGLHFADELKPEMIINNKVNIDSDRPIEEIA